MRIYYIYCTYNIHITFMVNYILYIYMYIGMCAHGFVSADIQTASYAVTLQFTQRGGQVVGMLGYIVK